jgi:hypothetical protein
LRDYVKSGVADEIRKAGGAIFAITSEPQTLAREARASWGLDFETVGDPHHEIANTCRERDWLHLFVQSRVDLVKSQAWARHPKGYFQPGVLALSREGRVLYRWRSRPTRKNIGGATGRPRAEQVWQGLRAALAQPAGAPDAPLDDPRLGSGAPPWPIFVFMLLANGNFVRPRVFGMERGGPDDVGARFARALAKGALFLGAWAAAFTLLSTPWVLGALALWALAVTPSLIHLHREFQSIPEGEPDVAAQRASEA